MKMKTTFLCVVIAWCALMSNAYAQSNQDIRKYTNVKYMVWQVHEGNYDKAIELCEARLERSPDDLEPLFGLAMVYGQMGQIEKAMAYVKQAVDGGMPFERFLVGPRELLAPLSASEAFQAYAKGRMVDLLHGPMLGNVTSTGAQFWVRTRTEIPVQIQLHSIDGKRPAILSSSVTPTAEKDYTAIISVDGLTPDTPYRYGVLVDGREVPLQPLPEFRTAMRSGTKTRFHVGFGGGANYRPENERMWDTVRSYSPRAFLFLGDNTYFNIPDVPAHQRYFFYRRHSRPEYRRMIASTAMYAIYDDHDFGGNDSLGGPEIDSPPWKRNVTLKTFSENFLNPYYGGGQENPGCWTDFSIGDVDFFLLDGRYYRTDPQIAQPSMLGPVQKKWLLNKLQRSTATFKIIASPVPWAFGTKPGSQNSATLGSVAGYQDTWEGFKDEREEIFGFIEQNRIEGVYLISADRHRSDAWKIERENGYDLYEANTSHLTKNGSHPLMPKAIFSHRGKPMFGLLTFDLTKPDPEIIYTVIDINNTPVDSLIVKRSQLGFRP